MKILETIRRSRIIKSVAGTSGLNLTATGLAFVVSIPMTRLLGAEGYGIYAYAISWIFILNIPATLGLDGLIIREVAASQSRQAWGLIQGLLRWSNQVVLLTSVTIALLSLAVAWGLTKENSQTLLTFSLALILLPLITLTSLRQSTLKGLHHVVTGQLPESLIQPLVFLVLLTSAYFIIPQEVNPPLVMVMRVVSSIIAFLVGTIMLYWILPKAIKTASPEYQVKQWLSSGLFMLLISGTFGIFSRTDSVMLGIIKGTETVGVYTISNRLSGLILFGMVIGCQVLGPHIASLYAEGKIQQLQRLTTKSTRTMFFAGSLITIILLVFGHWILLIFGREFTQGWLILAILSIGNLMNVATGAGGLLLNMTRYEADYAKLTSISAVMNILLNALLIPLWGAEGAASATTITMFFNSIWQVILVYQKLGIHSDAIGKINLPLGK
ncbi:MAG TPA: flippase [Cyanobacteria bacterium UBA11370]|nr:flippase [Cyanobacteria bacterium UBA11370]